MPAKTSTLKTPKTNVSSASRLQQKVKFNPKLVLALSILLIATLGFIYIFFSKASALKEYVYYAGYTTANNKNSVEVWDPTTKSMVKSIDLPAYPSQNGCTTNRPYWYDHVLELRSANRAFVIPSGCGGLQSESLLVPSIDTTTHTYTGKSLALTTKSGMLDVVSNEIKKQYYVHDYNGGTVTVVDGLTNAVVKTLNVNDVAGVFAEGIVVSGDGQWLVILYGNDERGSGADPTAYKNVVIYDTATYTNKRSLKANASGFAFKNRSHTHNAVSVAGSQDIYAVGRVDDTNGNVTKLQLIKITIQPTSIFAAVGQDLPTTNLQFDDVASIQPGYIHIMSMKGYDPNVNKAYPLLLKYNVSTKQFETAPGANIDTIQSGEMFASQDPSVAIITTYNTLSTYNFSTGAVNSYIPRQGTPVLGSVIPTTPSPTATATVSSSPSTSTTPTASTSTTAPVPSTGGGNTTN